MTWHRRLAIAAGIAFLSTHVSSIAAVALYAPLLSDTAWATGPGPDTGVLAGGFLELILAFGVIGTAVALYPIVRRQNEAIALGYAALRTLEAAIIVAGIVSLLAVVALRQEFSSGESVVDGTALIAVARSLVVVHNWTFLFGPGFTSGANTVLLAYLLYRGRLVPPLIPFLGLVGGPLVFLSATAVLFGAFEQYGTLPALLVLPEFAWELSLAIYLLARGLRRSSPLLRSSA